MFKFIAQTYSFSYNKYREMLSFVKLKPKQKTVQFK